MAHPPKKKCMVDWKNLPDDVLELIGRRLLHITDYVSFSAVCKTWWQSTVLRNRVSLPKGIPVLMIPGNNNEEEETRRFYSLTDKRVYDFQVPVPPKSHCRASTEYGWLVIVDINTCLVRLLNPFSRRNNEIQLPPLTALPKRKNDRGSYSSFFYKAVLSSNPSSTLDFVVLVIFGLFQDLAFCRPGDEAWTRIKREGLLKHVNNAVFYNQKFYVVDDSGKVMACDVNQPHPSLTKVASRPTGPIACGAKRYLVESSGDLLQIETKDKCCEDFLETIGFKLYKLDRSERKWIEVENLGDRMLFLGHNTPFSVPASAFPTGKSNCIYFTDDYDYDDDDDDYDDYLPRHIKRSHGVFSLEDESIEQLYPTDSQGIIPSPIWVLPGL